MLSRLVNVMVSLELRFVQERTEDGQLVYRLDPWVWDSTRADIRVLMPANRPVDSFVTYDGKRAADIPPPRYAVRHLVATEVSSR
jgi:chromosome transmission fidelity protein 18